MRVIAGTYKGKRLKAVPGVSTRPTTDKVKEAVFQVIGPYFQGGTCLDLFAGSGSLGLEAISRGMDRAIFVDQHPKAVQVIKQNVAQLNLESEVEVFRADAYRALGAAAKRGLSFDLIFLDPPYGKGQYEKLVSHALELHLLTEDGIIYCEHAAMETPLLNLDELALLKQENYGGTIGISIYQRRKL